MLQIADHVESRIRESGLLYPMLVISALTLTVFIIAGIANMLGWMPHGLAGQEMARVEGIRKTEAPAGTSAAGGGAASSNEGGAAGMTRAAAAR